MPRHALLRLLDRSARVTVISAPAGSGKTSLLRSWTRDAPAQGSGGWVTVTAQRDPQQFWLAVLAALRATASRSEVIREFTGAPSLDSWEVVQRLVEDLRAVNDPLCLIIDDLHELESEDALRQVERLILHSPDNLRFVLSTRADVRLGLHRLRLEGELTEIRAGDLRFTAQEARALFENAGLELSQNALSLLLERTEGWAAGLRLAALSLSGHPDPDRFAAEFSGSDRVVAEYLLGEVLDRLPSQVRRLLLRTSILERVDGQLADALTGGSDGEVILQRLEEANAFVLAIDHRRTWFRFHRLFAELLERELRRVAPEEVRSLHLIAADWLEAHGDYFQAVRHAQAAEDWSQAAQMLRRHWFALGLDGEVTTVHELIASFPPAVAAADPALIAIQAADALQHSLEEAEHLLALASLRLKANDPDADPALRVIMTVLRMSVANRRIDMGALDEEATQLLDIVAEDDASDLISDDVRALALIRIASAEIIGGQDEQASSHLEHAITLARRMNRPYLEIDGLVSSSTFATMFGSFADGESRLLQAVELARGHGWENESVLLHAYSILASLAMWQGRVHDAEQWLDRTQGTGIRLDLWPLTANRLALDRAEFERLAGRHREAADACRAAERSLQLFSPGGPLTADRRGELAATLLRVGDNAGAERVLVAGAIEGGSNSWMQIAVAALHLVRGDPNAAMAALAPVLEGVSALNHQAVLIEAHALHATILQTLDDPAGAGAALERALDLAEPNAIVLPFRSAAALLEHHRRRGSAHGALLSQAMNLLGRRQVAAGSEDQPVLPEQLSESELRILRYLPTNLSAPEMAREFHVSVNTVKTHMRHLYAKLGVHRRGEAVDRARSLGLLAPSTRRA